MIEFLEYMLEHIIFISHIHVQFKEFSNIIIYTVHLDINFNEDKSRSIAIINLFFVKNNYKIHAHQQTIIVNYTFELFVCRI